MIRENRPQPHCSSVENGFMAQAAQASVTMHDLNLLPNDNIPEYGEEGEDRGEGRGAIHDEERHMVDFEAIREIADTGAPIVRVSNDYHLVSTVDELGGELVDVALDAAGLGKEEVADQGYIVRGSGGGGSRALAIATATATAAAGQLIERAKVGGHGIGT